MPRTQVVSRPFHPGLAPPDTSGWCTICLAIRYGGCTPNAYGFACPECGRHAVVGRKDEVMLRHLDVALISRHWSRRPPFGETCDWQSPRTLVRG